MIAPVVSGAGLKTRLVRWAGLSLAAIVTLVLLLAAAWLLSNLRDIEPTPPPVAVALQVPRIDDARNSFYALVGLNAPPGRDPGAVGRALWKASVERAEPAQRKSATDSAASRPQEPGAAALPLPRGAPLTCDAEKGDCTAQWIERADALEAQRRTHAEIGQRCDEWSVVATQFEELLPPFRGADTAVTPHLVHASACATWLLSGAALSWARGRKAETIVRLEQAARVSRALLSGSRSLIGHMVALSIGRRTLDTLVALSLRDRAVAVALAPAIARWPDPTVGVRSWVRSEAAFQRAMVDDASTCGAGLLEPKEGVAGIGARLVGPGLAWLCRQRIGWHPERTRAAIDGHWLRVSDALDAGLGPAIERFEREHKAQSDASALSAPAWRNTFGHLALQLSAHSYQPYLVRHADLELQREAVLLALAAQQQAVPAAERASWGARQPLSAYARGRLVWDADGAGITLRTWQSEFAAQAPGARRAVMRVVWPEAAR